MILDQFRHALDPEEEVFENCSLCSDLSDELTNTLIINKAGKECVPDSFRLLIKMDRENDSRFLLCSGCGTYFHRTTASQMYGGGIDAEEQICRLSTKKSRLLDRFFSADMTDHPQPPDVREYLIVFHYELLWSALGSRLDRNPEIVATFLPYLVPLPGKQDDTELWQLLDEYVSDNPDRAEEFLKAFRRYEWDSNHLMQILHRCLSIAAKKD